MVACTRKEASCILGNFFGELCPICEICRELLDDELALKTASGLTLEGEAVLVIEGHSSITGKPAKVKLTDYGFEFFGDITEIARIRNARCCYIVNRGYNSARNFNWNSSGNRNVNLGFRPAL